MFSTLVSPPLRSLIIAVVAALLCYRLKLADAALAAMTSTYGDNRMMTATVQGYQNSSATPPHVTTTTKAAGPVECGILQESSGGSGDAACRWSSAFYPIVVFVPVVVLTAAVIVTVVLYRRRQRNRQGQENVEAKAADDKPEGRRKKNDYTGPPIPSVKVQQDPIDGDYSLVPDDGDHIYGNEETVYMNTELDLEQPAAVACSSTGGEGEGRGGATFARGTSSDADEIDDLPLAPRPPATRGVSKDRVHGAEGGGRKAARGPKAGATVETVGRASRQRTAGGSSSNEPSKLEVEADTAGSAPRQPAAAAAGGGEPSKPVVEASAAGRVSRQQAAGGGGRCREPSKPSEEEAAAAARTALADKLARAVAANRQQKKEKLAHDQETEPVYVNMSRQPH